MSCTDIRQTNGAIAANMEDLPLVIKRGKFHAFIAYHIELEWATGFIECPFYLKSNSKDNPSHLALHSFGFNNLDAT